MFKKDRRCNIVFLKIQKSSINNLEKAKEMRKILRGFYSVLKDYTGLIKFLLITGLTRLMKMFVFMEGKVEIAFECVNVI